MLDKKIANYINNYEFDKIYEIINDPMTPDNNSSEIINKLERSLELLNE